MNPYDPPNPNDPADRAPAFDARRLAYRFLSLPFYVQVAVLRGLGVPDGTGAADRPARDETFVASLNAIRERGLVARFADAVDAAWAKRGRS